MRGQSAQGASRPRQIVSAVVGAGLRHPQSHHSSEVAIQGLGTCTPAVLLE